MEVITRDLQCTISILEDLLDIYSITYNGSNYLKKSDLKLLRYINNLAKAHDT